jgi:hypothetical protein
MTVEGHDDSFGGSSRREFMLLYWRCLQVYHIDAFIVIEPCNTESFKGNNMAKYKKEAMCIHFMLPLPN